MANVYLAKDVFLDRKVAVKVLRGDLANDEKFIRRFQREAYAASSLSHPNIVEMYDVGEDNGTYYIVMEYIEGRTLKQLLKKRGNLTPAEVVDIMLQLTDGIAVAHDKYIIHRDLKPQNIMISDDGKIKITDFGIAMALNSTQVTQTNSVMGSVHYLPPEQASGKGSTTKSDIYSMGIMMFELLTGKLPFKGENAVEIALKHMKDDIPSVRKINSNIPQSLENIIIKSTAKNPKNRYDDVKEMYSDLKVCLNEENLNQAPVIYKYPEHEVDEKESSLKEVKENDDNKKEVEEEPVVAKKIVKEEKEKTSFSTFVIIFLSLVLIGGVAALFFMLSPLFAEDNDIKIPDVSNMSIVDAEKALVASGFKVKDETIKEHNDTIPEGMIIGTNPAAGRSKSKGYEVTLIESLGKNTVYEIENYVGKNYIEVQTTLEKMYKMQVEIKKKEVELTEDMDLQLIIDQDLKPGTKIVVDEEKPTKIVLYIPDAYDQYPDFVAEGWTVEEIQEFAEKYELDFTVKYEETDEFPPGTVIKQSRTGKIVNKATFFIVIAKEVETPVEPPEGEGSQTGEGSEQGEGTNPQEGTGEGTGNSGETTE